MTDLSLFDGDTHCGPAYSVILEPNKEKGLGGLLHANISGATDPVVLAEHRVRLIVQCASEHAGRVAEAASFAESIAGCDYRIDVLEIPMDDFDIFDIGPALAVALPRISSARSSGWTTLVNCAAGRSRSAAVILAHLMHMGADGGSAPQHLASAMVQLRTARPFAYPNLGFTVQLMARDETGSITPAMLRGHYGYRLYFGSDDDEGQAWVAAKLDATRLRALGTLPEAL